MRPEAALELVGKYARLQRRINLIKTEIGQALDPCPGIGNKRQMFDDDGGRCNYGTETHLGAWMADENDSMRSTTATTGAARTRAACTTARRCARQCTPRARADSHTSATYMQPTTQEKK